MTSQTALNPTRPEHDAGDILPADAAAAVQRLCRLTQGLIDLADRESQALIRQDALAFSILQDDKDTQARLYAKASQSFRARLDEFRKAPPALINKLETLQTLLGERVRNNNVMVDSLRRKAERMPEIRTVNPETENADRRIRFTASQHKDNQAEGKRA